MSDALVIVDGASKAFGRTARVSQKALTLELASLFFGGRPRSHITDDTFLALDNINLEVGRGEALGVIGHNGAGKTTLLRMLSGEYQPDKGRVEVRGRRSNLVDLTSGFSMSLTGRENIYFRGAHLGFSREFLREREQEIIDFAGIGEFVDSEMKSYSSGMLLRLGFAVSIFVDPDVLIVDEILAVGDFLFAAKCLRKMNEIKQNAAIIYVSHSLQQIINFTDRTLVLDRGRPVFIGDPAEAVDHYQRLELAKDQQGGSRLSREEGSPSGAAFDLAMDASAAEELKVAAGIDPDTEDTDPLPPLAHMGPFMQNTDAVTDVQSTWMLRDETPTHSIGGNEGFRLKILFTALRTIRRLEIGVMVWSSEGVYITCFATHARPTNHLINQGERHSITLDVPAHWLNKGEYHTALAIVDGGEHLYRQPLPVLQIVSNRATLAWGLITPDYSWTQRSEANLA